MDHYEVLGLEKSATQQEIKNAYRKLALKYHPDVNDTSSSSFFFRLIHEAYETLYDPKKRAAYDAGTTQEATPPSAKPTPQAPKAAPQAPKKVESIFREVDIRTVTNTWLLILLIPLKIVAAVLILPVSFLYVISYLISYIAALAGTGMMIIGLIGAVVFGIQNGVASMMFWYPVILAFVGFIIIIFGAGLPALFVSVIKGLFAFMRFVPKIHKITYD